MKHRLPETSSRANLPDSTVSRNAIVGFTLIEMVIVMVLISILAAIAIPGYLTQMQMSREAVLKHNLAVLRERLDQHKADRHKFPEGLEQLVEAGYLKKIPEDPMTSQSEWEEVFSDYDQNDPDAAQGVEDVHSRSETLGSDGRPYSEW